MNLGINNKLILFISLTFSLLVGSKFYGFGRDYYHAYFKPNLDWGRWYDFLGYRVSTFTVYDINFGVYIVSFLLSISCGILLKQFFIIIINKRSYHIFNDFLISLIKLLSLVSFIRFSN